MVILCYGLVSFRVSIEISRNCARTEISHFTKFEGQNKLYILNPISFGFVLLDFMGRINFARRKSRYLLEIREKFVYCLFAQANDRLRKVTNSVIFLSHKAEYNGIS